MGQGALAAVVGGQMLVGRCLMTAHHQSRHHLVKEVQSIKIWKNLPLTLVSTRVPIAPIASAMVAELMISPTTPVRRAVGGLLGVVGGHGVKAFSVVGGKSSLVGRLTARPLRQRGTQDRLALGN